MRYSLITDRKQGMYLGRIQRVGRQELKTVWYWWLIMSTESMGCLLCCIPVLGHIWSYQETTEDLQNSWCFLLHLVACYIDCPAANTQLTITLGDVCGIYRISVKTSRRSPQPWPIRKCGCVLSYKGSVIQILLQITWLQARDNIAPEEEAYHFESLAKYTKSKSWLIVLLPQTKLVKSWLREEHFPLLTTKRTQ